MVTRTLRTVLFVAALAPFAANVHAETTAQAGDAASAVAAPAAQPEHAETPPHPGERPRLLHAPVTVATAHHHILIYADIVDPELVKRALVVYAPAGGDARAVDLRRASEHAGYVAEIPASDVRAPSLGYTIELELTDGSRVSAFATRDVLHAVSVLDDYLDLREQALAKRLGGRRSVVSTEAEYVSFGNSDAAISNPIDGFHTVTVADHYYRAEAAYTYRPLGFVTEFSTRLGFLRGESPVPAGAGIREGGVFDVGLDYIAPSVRLRFTDTFHGDFELLTGLTEEKFRIGALSRLLIGDPYGSKLVLGVQGIDGFGVRFWSRVDITATDRLSVSPIIEATNWPHADAFGVRLLLDLSIDFGGGFGAVVGGGYQARQATSGGPSAELSLRYAF